MSKNWKTKYQLVHKAFYYNDFWWQGEYDVFQTVDHKVFLTGWNYIAQGGAWLLTAV